jgi:hypothetical protein
MRMLLVCPLAVMMVFACSESPTIDPAPNQKPGNMSPAWRVPWENNIADVSQI